MCVCPLHITTEQFTPIEGKNFFEEVQHKIA